ncbi:MAG: rod shape-determining protein MreC [Myxococcaceae bacterium]
MLALLKRHLEPLLVLVLLAYPLISLLGSGRRVREPNVVDRALLGVSAPLQRALVAAIDGVTSGWERYVSLRRVERENLAMREEISELRQAVSGMQETRGENERLRRLLNYTETQTGSPIAARVVGINPDANRLTVRIDRGEGDGVTRNMPVVTPDGVVGQVLRVTSGSADVLLLADPNSRLGVRVQRTRARAGAAGTGDERLLRLDYLARAEDLEEGDPVVTSGTDGVYPAGLMVGRATQVQRQGAGMFLGAMLLPSVDFSRLEEVLVLSAVPSATGLLPRAAPVPARVEERQQ